MLPLERFLEDEIRGGYSRSPFLVHRLGSLRAGGGLVIRAGEGVLAEYRKTGSLEASLDQLEQSPGLAWVGQLRDDPKADWRGVEAAFKEWDYEAQGLTEAGAALVSLIAVAATAGTLSTLSAAIAKGLGIAGQGAMHVAMQGAIKAGLTSLVSQASVALVNNRGDLGATLKQLGSSATLTSLATAMITAGLTSGIESAIGIGADLPASAPLADRVVHDLQRGLVRASVRAGVTTAIQDGEIGEAFISAVRLEAAYALGQNAAREIGIAAAHGDLDTAGQLIAHAALGCAIGAAASGDCGSGALGGFVGETVGLLRGQAIEEWAAQRLADVRDGTLKEGGFLAELNELKAAGVDMARLAGGFAAALAGGDADLGAGTAGNAAENNAVFTTTALIVIALGALYATVLGEGDPGKGLARIGEGEDPLSKAIAAGAAEAVKLSYEAFPEATEDVLWALEQSGNAMDATISWIDAATGETVSKAWSALDEETRNQIKGGTIIVTVGLSAGTVKYLSRLRNLRPKAPNGGTPEGGKVIEKVASRKLPFDDPERVTEVNKTLDRIENGGPFPHIEDDKVFENRDGLLPKRGEYREYTVDTPGMSHRAKRRIVIDIKSGRTYYTDDHYDSFVEINPRRD